MKVAEIRNRSRLTETLEWQYEKKDERSRSRMAKLENKLKSADLFDYYARSLSGGD